MSLVADRSGWSSPRRRVAQMEPSGLPPASMRTRNASVPAAAALARGAVPAWIRTHLAGSSPGM
ncbi:MAG: hypothetical protein ABUL57_01920, partial [Chloroflexota bacterium]